MDEVEACSRIRFGTMVRAFRRIVFLFSVREGDRALFESLITVVGVASAVTGTVLYFRDVEKSDIKVGLLLGLVWGAISIIIDLPIFLGIFDMSLRNYAVDIALTYLAFPAITMGIATAKSARPTSLDSY